MTSNETLPSAEELLSVLPLLNRLIAVKLRQEIDEEITLSQFRVLTQLQEHSITLSELADQRHVTRQAASLQVQGLVERGWVRRVPDLEDRRQAWLEVTEEGLSRWGQARTSLIEYLAGLLQELTTEEFEALQVLIPALKRVMERARDPRKLSQEESESAL
ncbi:MAG TPA: MarR family transcriptional regulator [Aggregatilineales bacterium]|nr:MarR family transcriptional regulator [Aggregatilineales bacterium]